MRFYVHYFQFVFFFAKHLLWGFYAIFVLEMFHFTAIEMYNNTYNMIFFFSFMRKHWL